MAWPKNKLIQSKENWKLQALNHALAKNYIPFWKVSKLLVKYILINDG